MSTTSADILSAWEAHVSFDGGHIILPGVVHGLMALFELGPWSLRRDLEGQVRHRRGGTLIKAPYIYGRRMVVFAAKFGGWQPPNRPSMSSSDRHFENCGSPAASRKRSWRSGLGCTATTWAHASAGRSTCPSV